MTYFAFLIIRPGENIAVPLIILSEALAEAHPHRVSEVAVVEFEEITEVRVK
jgi:hypothetical protein